RLDGLVGTNQGLPARVDLASECLALGLDRTDVSGKLSGIRAPRDACVNVDTASGTAQAPQFVDLSAAIFLGFASLEHQVIVTADHIGEQSLALVALVHAQLEQRIKFEREFFHSM